MSQEWSRVKVMEVTDSSSRKNALGFSLTVRARVELGSLSPGEVKVEALLGNVAVNRELREVRPVELAHSGNEGSSQWFEGTATLESAGHKGYIVRVTPNHPDVAIPIEMNHVAWEGG